MIYLKLFFVFAKIGLFSFGGGIAMLPIIYQNAQDFGFMNQNEFDNLVAVSQVTPGPIAVNAATYVGYNSAGFLGGVAATFGVVLPSFIIVSIVYYFITKFRENQLVDHGFAGVKPVTAGLMAAATVFVTRGIVVNLEIIPIVIFIITFLLMYYKKVGTIGIVIFSGIIGAFVKAIGII